MKRQFRTDVMNVCLCLEGLRGSVSGFYLYKIKWHIALGYGYMAHLMWK